MSDTRTDREELAQTMMDDPGWALSAAWERVAFYEMADRVLAAGFRRHTENVFELNASPGEIHHAVDVLRDLDVTDGDWEYGDYEATHVSGFRFIPADGYMPVHLRPDIGEDRVDI